MCVFMINSCLGHDLIKLLAVCKLSDFLSTLCYFRVPLNILGILNPEQESGLSLDACISILQPLERWRLDLALPATHGRKYPGENGVQAVFQAACCLVVPVLVAIHSCGTFNYIRCYS